MEFLLPLEESGLGMLISSSIWGYPIALSLHALGMGVLVGISVMFALRIVGFADAIPITAIKPYWRLAIAGFLVNLISGTALFMGSATSLAANWAFLSKIGMLTVSLILTYQMVKVCMTDTAGEVTNAHRLLAISSLSAWVVTIIFGRLIGYIF
ncbi:hypothetical protein [Yoonia sp. MH D7]